MNRAFEKELSRALAAEPDTAVPETLLRRCWAEHVVKQRSDWRDLLHCQFKLLGWKVWALEAMVPWPPASWPGMQGCCLSRCGCHSITKGRVCSLSY